MKLGWKLWSWWSATSGSISIVLERVSQRVRAVFWHLDHSWTAPRREGISHVRAVIAIVKWKGNLWKDKDCEFWAEVGSGQGSIVLRGKWSLHDQSSYLSRALGWDLVKQDGPECPSSILLALKWNRRQWQCHSSAVIVLILGESCRKKDLCLIL